VPAAADAPAELPVLAAALSLSDDDRYLFRCDLVDFPPGGVALLRRPADLDRWETAVRREGTPGPYLVEDYLTGPEFSVETLSCDGVHQVVGITAKRTTGPPGFVETGHVFPAPLPEPQATAVRRATTALLDRAGYRFGPAHTEVILTPRGPRIVESQARLGGDRIPLLIATATGFDIERAVFDALADGRPAPPPTPHRYAAIRFFRLPPGRLAGTGDTDAIRALPHVHALHFPFRPGDCLPPVTSTVRLKSAVFSMPTSVRP
jgi:biotin carboxylase